MTTFQDGPAKGATLELRRSPMFLRVVVGADGKVDALDQREDEPRIGEHMHPYVLAKYPTFGFIRRGGGGGQIAFAEYKLCSQELTQAMMQSPTAWQTWCASNTAEIPVEILWRILT